MSAVARVLTLSNNDISIFAISTTTRHEEEHEEDIDILRRLVFVRRCLYWKWKMISSPDII